jgi:hypothetical protein
MRLTESYSQAGQDFAAAEVCNKRNGFFLDLGCNDPVFHNNTYALELELDWTGILLDINGPLIKKCMEQRSPDNKYLTVDLIHTNINDVLDQLSCPNWIDYISFDVDAATPTVLDQIDLSLYQFGFMTFEHDSYRLGSELKIRMTEKALEYGYIMYREDVPADQGEIFEDWWIHPSVQAVL